MEKVDIIIIGAGASGLMVGRDLSKAGKKVLILEARDRIGGRIWPLPASLFGYVADAGAEFIHGEAPVTQGLIAEAGLTFIPTEGENWSVREGAPTKTQRVKPEQDVLNERLGKLEVDMPIAEFMALHLAESQFEQLRNSILKMVEGYDAADPKRISTFSLRDDWLSGGEWKQGKIREGYAGLLAYLEAECKKHKVQIHLNMHVTSVALSTDGVLVTNKNGDVYEAGRVVVTAALPTIASIDFTPDIPKKREAIEMMGYGSVIKLLLKFTDRWWVNCLEQDLSQMLFMNGNEEVRTWWTQYPNPEPVLTGWIVGFNMDSYAKLSDEDILALAFTSLEKTFKVDAKELHAKLVTSHVANWPADPLALGAYSYSTPETNRAKVELTTPVERRIFFAGEALSSGGGTSTVEGALSSGAETAQQILNSD